MKLNVNLFKPSGEWACGGVVEVSELNPFWSHEFRREVLINQDFVIDTAFADHTVVITHRDDYSQDPSPYFAQTLWAPSQF